VWRYESLVWKMFVVERIGVGSVWDGVVIKEEEEMNREPLMPF
jgi:hypothetical protein